MKALILLSTLLLSLSSMAETALYAKVEGEVIKCTFAMAQTPQTASHIVSSGDCGGYEFLLAESFCFNGKRSELIEEINSDLFDFDEEWVGSAKYHGKAMSFVVFDGPNDLKEKKLAKRCTDSFFQ